MVENNQIEFFKKERQYHHIKTDRKIIVPVSSGKDRTATLILALKNFPKEQILAVHYNTGWDHPKTYEYLNYISHKSGINVHHTKYNEAPTMVDLIRRRKKFPNRILRFCTQKLKETAINRWLKKNGFYDDRKGQVWLGIRSDESYQRKKKYGHLDSKEVHIYKEVFPYTPKCLSTNVNMRFPVIDWSTQDCFDEIKEYGWKYNTLYDEGCNRVGCYPCLLSGKKRQMAEFGTEFGQHQMRLIKDLEKELNIKYEMFEDDQGSCEVCKI